MFNTLKELGKKLRRKDEAVAEDMKDQVADGKDAIAASEKQIKDFMSKIAGIVSHNKKLGLTRKDKKDEVKKYDAIAKKAGEAGNADHVRQAVEKINNAKAEVSNLDVQIKKNEQLISSLRKQLDKARAKVAEAKSNINQLAAREDAAKIRKELAQAGSDFGDGGPLAALDNLKDKVSQDEVEAEAYEELSGTGEDSLEEVYATEGVSDDDIAKYMKK